MRAHLRLSGNCEYHFGHRQVGLSVEILPFSQVVHFCVSLKLWDRTAHVIVSAERGRE